MPNRQLTEEDLDYMLEQIRESFAKISFGAYVFHKPEENLIDISESDLSEILEI